MCGPSSQVASVSSARASSTAGTTARPHCLADDTAIRCQRSRRWPRSSAASVISLRRGDDRLNRGDAHHHRVAHHVVHLVALEHRLRQRDRDARLRRGRGLGVEPHAPRRSSRPPSTDAVELAPAAVEDAHRRAPASAAARA